MNITYWRRPEELEKNFSYAHWNSDEAARNQVWYIDSPDQISRVTDLLNSIGLQREFDFFVNRFRHLVKGNVLDVAAGICWATAQLSKLADVSAVDALEFSLPRIDKFADNVIAGLNGDESKIRKIYGSFYDIHPERKYDLAYLSQAFHHADKPVLLLAELDRVLKPGGAIAMLGEHPVTSWQIFKRFIRVFLDGLRSGKLSFIFNFRKLFPPDLIGGDHEYRRSDYQLLLESLGYSVEYVPVPGGSSTIIVALKPAALT
jgi:SAM-dependent methyltransferase